MMRVFQIKVIVNDVLTATFPVKAVNHNAAVNDVTALLAGNRVVVIG